MLGEDPSAGDAHTGVMTSNPFTIERRYIHALIGGGSDVKHQSLQLLIDGEVVMKVRKCNKCLREKDISKFRKDKLTCIKCEYRFKQRWLRSLVKERRLTPAERLSNRFGYMGTAFIMISPYLLPYDNIGAYTYIIGACLSIPQVFVAKQWNLVIVNLNLLVGYGAYIFN